MVGQGLVVELRQTAAELARCILLMCRISYFGLITNCKTGTHYA